MSKTGERERKKKGERKRRKKKGKMRGKKKKNVRIFFTSKLPVANKFHKFSSASRYRGRNEVWEEGSWFSVMFSSSSIFLVKHKNERRRGKKRERKKKEEREAEKKEEGKDRMVLTMWKFIDGWKMMSSDSFYPCIRTLCVSFDEKGIF